MLICEPRRCVSNVDRMAMEHLQAAGIIFPHPAGRPKSDKPVKTPKRGKIGWKRLGPMRSGACAQCGGCEIEAKGDWPYGMKLCQSCANVHLWSVNHGLARTDEIFW